MAFIDELKAELATSYSSQRKNWAQRIASEKINLESLKPLLLSDKRTTARFLYTLGDLGEIAPDYLFSFLPSLFEIRNQNKAQSAELAFSRYWHLCGIPEEQEAYALDKMFDWIMDAKMKVSVKCYAVECIARLLKKYPDLKTEFIAVLEDQFDKNSTAFKYRASVFLKQLK